MKKAAIVFCSRMGHTEKIAYHIRNRLLARGFEVDMFTAEDSPVTLDPSFSMVIAGGPLYLRRFSPQLIQWGKNHAAELKSRTSAFFSVSLNAADERPACRIEDEFLLHKFAADTGWRPDHMASFAGALKYTRYNWFLRRLMRMISHSAGGPTDTSRDYELTDWNQINHFVENLIEGGPRATSTTAAVIQLRASRPSPG